jgi:hypothetical protein
LQRISRLLLWSEADRWPIASDLHEGNAGHIALFRASPHASTQVLREICNAGLRLLNLSGVVLLALQLQRQPITEAHANRAR